jgi:hypothetical protein
MARHVRSSRGSRGHGGKGKMIPKEIESDPGIADIFELGTEPEYKPDPEKVARSAKAIRKSNRAQLVKDVQALDRLISCPPAPFWKNKLVRS